MAELLALGDDLKSLTAAFKRNADGSGAVLLTGDGRKPELRLTAAEAEAAVKTWTPPAPKPAAASYDGFSALSPPPGAWRPYSSSSAFNRGTVGAVVHPQSAQLVQAIFAEGGVSKLVVGASTAGVEEWNHSVYFPTEDDPVYVIIAVHNKEWGFPAFTPTVRLSKGARPASGSDHHLCAVEAGGREVDMWDASVDEATRTITCGSAGESRIDDAGNTNVATAAGFSLLAGVIRGEEWAGGEINHALFCITKAVSGAIVYPAIRSASKGSGTLPATGAWLKLNYTPQEVAELPIPAYRKTFVAAMAAYGAFIGDTGGNAGLGFQTLSGQSYTSQGAADPLVAFAQKEGAPRNTNGTYSLDLTTGVDWAGRLQVLTPPAV